MADFVSWAVEYQRAKDALANRSWDAYFTESVENSEEMRNTYTALSSVSKFIDWLKVKASVEASGFTEGSLLSSIGGN